MQLCTLGRSATCLGRFRAKSSSNYTLPSLEAPGGALLQYGKSVFATVSGWISNKECPATVIYPSGLGSQLDNCQKKCLQAVVCNLLSKMVATMLAQTSSFLGTKTVVPQKQARVANRGVVAVRAGAYDEELIQTAVCFPAVLCVKQQGPACVVFTALSVAGIPSPVSHDLSNA